MTRSQRRTHLIAWLVLGPLVVAVLVLALRAKPERDARTSEARAAHGVAVTP